MFMAKPRLKAKAKAKAKAKRLKPGTYTTRVKEVRKRDGNIELVLDNPTPAPIPSPTPAINYERPDYYQVKMLSLTGDEHNCQAVDIMEAIAPGDIHLAHVIPYLVRAGKKNISNGTLANDEIRLEDLKKARWWLNRCIARLSQHIEDAKVMAAIETNRNRNHNA